jgi:branched-subunit amino acid transport protein AzlD
MAILVIPSLIAIALIPQGMSGKTVSIFLLLVLVVYNYKTVKLLAEKTGIHILRTAGKLLIIATVIDTGVLITLAVLYYAMGINYLTIGALLSPGIFISNAAWGLTAKGFFALQPPAKPIIQDQPHQRQILYCPNCGTSTNPNESYCVKCGTKLK